MSDQIINFNLQGMDLRNPFGDGLMYLQDATVTPLGVKVRPGFPTKQQTSGGYSYCVATAASPAPSLNGEDVLIARVNGATDHWKILSTDPATAAAGEYSKAYPVAGDETTQVGTNTAFGDYVDGARVGDEVAFAMGGDGTSVTKSLALWGGSHKTTVLSSTTSTRTVSSTSGSNVLTFSGAVTGLDTSWNGAYIYLSGFPKRPFRIVTVPGTTSVRIDTNLDASTAGQTWCIQPVAWVGAPDGAFLTGTALNEVVASCIEGHVDRLFAGNIVSDQTATPTTSEVKRHRVHYSGTYNDISGHHRGIHYWGPESYFEAAPEMGTRIVAMQSFGGDLIIFKDRGIAVLRGVVANDDPTKFGARVDILSDSIRCNGTSGVCKTPFGVFLASPDGLFIVTGDGPVQVDEKVRPWMDENLTGSFNGIGSVSLPCFNLGGKVYLRGASFQDASTDWRQRYLVWDYGKDVWSCRTFKDNASPSCATPYREFQVAMCGSAVTSTESHMAYFSTREEAWNEIAPTEDFPIFQLVTNGMVNTSEYPGFARVETLHVLHKTSTATTFKAACVPNFMYNLQTPALYGDSLTAEYTFADSAADEYPKWQRLHFGTGTGRSVTTNAIVSHTTDVAAQVNTSIYGICAFVNHSDITSTEV